MTYRTISNVICLGDLKQAALFFDRIIPVEDSSEIYKFRDVSERSVVEMTFRGKDILRNLLGVAELEASNVWVWIASLLYAAQKVRGDKHGQTDRHISLARAYIENLQLPEEPSLFQMFQSRNFRECFAAIAETISMESTSILLPEEVSASDSLCEDEISIALMNIPLVDTSKVSWEQILEYRKNEEAKSKLRNLRLFLHTNYEQKSSAYIEDDLGKRLDDYLNTCKDYGFETTVSMLGAVMKSKNLMLAGSTSLVAAILGASTTATIAALVGASIEIANISLEIAKRSYGYKKFNRDHDLAYIIETQKRLKQVYR